MSSTIPERVRWAVETLAVEPEDRLLEIGCGPGVAISLIAERLDGGTISAIDRSPVAVERARWRNGAHVESGLATIRKAALEELQPSGERYDKVFAVNVNVFWVRDAGRELDLIRSLLAPGGSLFLFYGGAPAEARTTPIADTVLGALTKHGFSATQLTPPAGSPLLGFVARLPTP
ncbi:MAG TPA: class I SAM-dependent methyltransferase [Gaiellaceae bacterium]|nr:class I SAM-dependent methyltransferase [Gaiellaceae bacterium]